MTPKRRSRVVLSIGLLVLVAAPASVFACTCRYQPFELAYADRPFVFAGIVQRRFVTTGQYGQELVAWDLEITEQFAGKHAARRVLTDPGSSCAFDLRIGTRYLMFLRDPPEISHCRDMIYEADSDHGTSYVSILRALGHEGPVDLSEPWANTGSESGCFMQAFFLRPAPGLDPPWMNVAYRPAGSGSADDDEPDGLELSVSMRFLDPGAARFVRLSIAAREFQLVAAGVDNRGYRYVLGGEAALQFLQLLDGASSATLEIDHPEYGRLQAALPTSRRGTALSDTLRCIATHAE